MKVLKDKAKSGVCVRLLIDRIGAMKVKKNALRPETKRCARFFANKPGFPYFFYRLNARNHRKSPS
ncbi:hypothetical protein PO124_05340 [Bacillus licheniformis]|nr:hypothetical protein [Bacillus licheniformis]